MPEFTRYRDANGSEFSSAVSAELAEKKGWTDITDDKNPAVGSDRKPLRAKPADRTTTAAKATPKPATPAANDTKGA